VYRDVPACPERYLGAHHGWEAGQREKKGGEKEEKEQGCGGDQGKQAENPLGEAGSSEERDGSPQADVAGGRSQSEEDRQAVWNPEKGTRDALTRVGSSSASQPILPGQAGMCALSPRDRRRRRCLVSLEQDDEGERHDDAFEDEVLATALLDRLLHHVCYADFERAQRERIPHTAEVLPIHGRSSRMKERQTGLSGPSEAALPVVGTTPALAIGAGFIGAGTASLGAVWSACARRHAVQRVLWCSFYLGGHFSIGS
jgi:hypothetical protein